MMFRSLTKIVQNYGQRYHKFKLTRLLGEEVMVMLPDDATVTDLHRHLQHNFPREGRKFLTGSLFSPNVQDIVVSQQMKQASEGIKEQPFMPILLANDLFVYQTNQNDKVELLYGIQCIEVSLTNNRNIPEVIQNGLVNLAYDWDNARTVGQALSMPRTEDPSSLQEQKNEINEYIRKVMTNMQQMNNVQMKYPLSQYVNKMSLLMGSNWIFLYIITFGYYGWDVGEPISYLTAVGVDLLAMLGWFDLQKKLNQEFQVNQGRYIGLFNLMAQKRNQHWLHCYLRRQIN